jgi:uncharacterized protein
MIHTRDLVAALILALGIAGSAIAGPLEDGADAAKRRDYVTALRLWRPLAEQGDAKAQTLLGAMYYEGGQGVPQDYAAALNWFRKAANQGNADAQRSLAGLYYSGKGVPQDDAEAAKWFRKAADQGDANSQSFLGRMYFLGHGVPEDYVAAHMWLNLATAGGEKKAAEIRDMVAKEMIPAQIAEAQKLAREWKPLSSSPR